MLRFMEQESPVMSFVLSGGHLPKLLKLRPDRIRMKDEKIRPDNIVLVAYEREFDKGEIQTSESILNLISIRELPGELFYPDDEANDEYDD